MAQSTCPKCENTSFEIAENSPKGSRFKFTFIQCDRCGAVVGVVDYYNVGNILTKIGAHLEMPEYLALLEAKAAK